MKKYEKIERNEDSTILELLQNIAEDNLSKEYILPMMEAMGYTSQFVGGGGGNGEKGKDLIGWKKNEIFDIELLAIQTKKIKTSANSRLPNRFSYIINQLIQASKEMVINLNGTEYTPNKVWFITPYPILPRVIESIKTQYIETANDKKLRVIDGGELLSLLRHYFKGFEQKLIGLDSQVRSTSEKHLTDHEIAGAIRAKERLVENYYSDIDLTLGRPLLRAFLEGRKIFETQYAEMTDTQWKTFKKIINETQSFLGIVFSEISEIEIEKGYNEQSLKQNVWKQTLEKWNKKKQFVLTDFEKLDHELWKLILDTGTKFNHISEIVLSLKEYFVNFEIDTMKIKLKPIDKIINLIQKHQKETSNEKLSITMREIGDKLNKVDQEIKSLDSGTKIEQRENISKHRENLKSISVLFSSLQIDFLSTLSQNGEINKEFCSLYCVIRSVLNKKSFDVSHKKISNYKPKSSSKINQFGPLNDKFNLIFLETIRIFETVQKLEQERNSFPKEPEPPKYSIKLDGIINFLSTKRDDYKHNIAMFNKEMPNRQRLKHFLQESKYMFELVDVLLGILPASFNVKKKNDRENKNELRIPIRPQTVFNTGLNFFLLGEAGAGKTTALRAYLAELRNQKSDNRLVIYIPLGIFVPIWNEQDQTIKEYLEYLTDAKSLHKEVPPPIPDLIKGLFYYYRSLGNTISIQDIARRMRTEKTIMMLDGIDECITFGHWIIESIMRIAETFPLCQVITSSRFSGEYAVRLSFIQIQLLPYTKPQILKAIEKHFGKSREDQTQAIRTHLALNAELYNVVTNPLLLRILCELGERNIRLPQTELALYEERLNLLLGEYDRFKGIERQKSSYRDLKRAATKIAHFFHSKRLREMRKENIITILMDNIHEPIENCILLVEELIHPCEILSHYEEHPGYYGFGHLRFQEYLTMEEIKTNRIIKVNNLISDPWWKGVFNLWAQGDDRDMEWLIEDLAVRGELLNNYENIFDIIKTKTAQSKYYLSNRINELLKRGIA